MNLDGEPETQYVNKVAFYSEETANHTEAMNRNDITFRLESGTYTIKFFAYAENNGTATTSDVTRTYYVIEPKFTFHAPVNGNNENLTSYTHFKAFSCAHTMNKPEGVTMYTAAVKEGTEGKKVTITELTGDLIPANTGVLLATNMPGATSAAQEIDFTTATNPWETIVVNQRNDLVPHLIKGTISSTGDNGYNYIFGYEALQAENEQLRVVMSQQNQDIRNSQSYKQENEHLRALLSLQDKHTDFTFEIANVVSWDSSSYGSVMTISKGSSSGLEAVMCAITADGQVLGLISEVGSSWATVTTILDTTSEIGSYIFGSGYSCIAQGNFELMRQGTLRASYISSSATIRNGDQLLTSGDGDIYPAGLVVGTVTDVGNDEVNVAKYAIITPMVNINTVEQVFIIKSFDIND